MDDDAANVIVAQLLFLEADDPEKDVHLYLNSPGGSITAALFLQDFVTKGLPWAHLDIAGTVWSDKPRGVDPAGATGFGVRTLVAWLVGGAAC